MFSVSYPEISLTLLRCRCFHVCVWEMRQNRCVHRKRKSCCFLLLDLKQQMLTPDWFRCLFSAELPAARRVHRYPASIAQHRQRLLAPGVWLRMYQSGYAEWDRLGSGSCSVSLWLKLPTCSSSLKQAQIIHYSFRLKIQNVLLLVSSVQMCVCSSQRLPLRAVLSIGQKRACCATVRSRWNVCPARWTVTLSADSSGSATSPGLVRTLLFPCLLSVVS